MYASHPRTDRRSRRSVLALLGVGLLVLAAAVPGLAQDAKPNPPIVEKCCADLAARLSVKPEQVAVASIRATQFRNAALGLPKPGEMVAQVITPGWSMYLRVKNATYLYTASKSYFRYGGPVDAWEISLLCVKPNPKDVNLNGTLVQLSPVGTNATVVLEEVTSFYPQKNGALFATRRTSRSGFDLLYLAPGERGKGRRIASGLDFGPAALAEDGKTYAAFVRTGLGQGLSLMVGSLEDGAGKAEVRSLPSGIVGQALRWDGDTVVTWVKDVDKTVHYLLLYAKTAPSWKKLDYAPRLDETSMLLNKSESLVVEGTQVDGKPAARVCTRWFTGDERDVTIVKDFRIDTIDLIEGSRFIAITGRKGDVPAVALIDFRSHETLVLTGQGFAGARAWAVPTRSAPVLPSKPAE